MSSTITISRTTRQQTRADLTDRIAREIVAAETAKRQEKTARLRLSRLERDAIEQADKPTASAKKKRKSVR